MGQSRVSAPEDQGIGTRAADLSAWDKLQLGWLDYEVVVAGQSRTLDLGPHEYNSAKAQGVVVVLPEEGRYDRPRRTGRRHQAVVVRDGRRPRRRRCLGRSRSRPAAGDADLPGAVEHRGLRARRRATTRSWRSTTAPAGRRSPARSPSPPRATASTVRPTAGRPGHVRPVGLRRQDGRPAAALPHRRGRAGQQPRQDRRASSRTSSCSPRARRPSSPTAPRAAPTAGRRTASRRSGATKSESFDHYYVASNRTYASYDQYMQTGPYNFGFPATGRTGSSTSRTRTGCSSPTGTRRTATTTRASTRAPARSCRSTRNPRPIYRLDGKAWRGRVQTYDAPFSLEKSDSFTLHAQETGQASYIRGQAAVPVFDDRRSYWDPALPTVGVKVPNAGVQLQVAQQQGTSMRLRLSSTK